MFTYPLICPYCNIEAKLIENQELYNKPIPGKSWVCSNRPHCDASVGTHGGSQVPKGTMARKGLRLQRMRLHEQFDTLWKNKTGERHQNRRDAYKLLSELMKIPFDETHIAMFDEQRCNLAFQVLSQHKERMRRK